MASYLPNVQTYIPQLEPFTPDYKFLQDVLQIRQDRYDTNYKAINDLYGQVVYAPLSRENNKIKRDQYANQLSNKLKQVSGLDLSLQQNVETAKGLFRPFYEDKNIVKDIIYTKGYQQSKKEGERWKNSTNRERRQMYSRDSDVWLDYRMQDFINATDEGALGFEMPKFVKNANLFMEGQKLLSDPNGDGNTDDAMSIKYTTFEGDYIVEHVNGIGMTSIPYVDENGETKYRNAPMEFLAQAFQDDPRIQEGYYIIAKVREREWAEANKGSYGGNLDAAKRGWRESQLTDGVDKEIIKLAELDTELKGDSLTVAQWEAYKKKFGIKTGSVEDDFLFKKQTELHLKRKTRDMLSTHIQDQKSPTDDERMYANKAYGAWMFNEIGKDMYSTAVSYATRSSEKTKSVNKAVLQAKKIAFEAAKFDAEKLHDMNMEMIKQANKMELQRLKNEGKKGGGKDGDKTNNRSVLDNILSTWSDAGNANRIGERVDINVIGENWTELKTAYENNTKYMWGAIELVFDNIGEAAKNLSAGQGGGFNIGSADNPNIVSIQEAKNHYLKPENYAELNRIYNKVYDWYSNIEYITPQDGGDPVVLRTEFPGKWSEQLISQLGQLDVEIKAAEAYLPEVQQNFMKTEQQGFNVLRNQPEYANSQYAINAKNGYSDFVVSTGYYNLSRYGFTDADLWAAEDAVRQDGQRHWDWIEEQVPWLVDEDYTGTESFRDRIWNSDLMHLSENEYRNMGILQLMGRSTATIDANGQTVHNQDGLADMTNYLNTWYGNGGKNTDGNSPWDDPNANNFMSRENSLRGEVWAWDDRKGWEFNQRKAQNLLDAHYRGMVTSLNGVFTSDKAKNGEYPTPHVINDLYGQDEILGSDQRIYPKNFTPFNSLDPSSASLDNFNGLHAALQATDATSIIKFGNYETEFPDDTKDDAFAKLFLESHWLRDVHNGTTEADERNVNIAWSQVMGGPDSRITNEEGEEEYYSGYVLTFPQDELDKYKGLSLEIDGKTKTFKDMMEGTGGQITVLVAEAFDRMNNPKNMSRNKPNALQLIIDNNSTKTYQPPPIPGGGEVIYYVNGNGQYMERITMYGYNSETGNFEPDASRKAESPVDRRKLNAQYATTQEMLKQNAAVQYSYRNNDIDEEDKK
jgi:hypothetical protein